MAFPLFCKICNKEFYVQPYRKLTAKCCSRACLWHYTLKFRESKRIKAISGKKASNSANKKMRCKRCAKIFDISPSRIGKKWFCSKLCYSDSQKKPKKSYKRITVNGKRILEHRYVYECYLKRPLNKNEHIHHIDGNPKNNDLSNLILMSISEHAKLTYRENRLNH